MTEPTRRSFLKGAAALTWAGSAGTGAARAAALGNFGTAPEFTGIEAWLNTPPLTLAELRGRVVLVDFWTYSCINCVRTLPHVIRWYDTYRSKGLVVVGVHTPEFAFERDRRNVERALQRFGITYPVAIDNRYGTWRAYRTRYWPSHFLIDRSGTIVYQHAGEGEEQITENAIRTLLAEAPAAGSSTGPDLSRIGTPEIHLGLLRLQGLANVQQPSRSEQAFTAPASLPANGVAVVGRWVFDDEGARLAEGAGSVWLRFRAAKVHLVAASPRPVRVIPVVDGKEMPPVTIEEARLYTLFEGSDYGEHELKLEIPAPGLDVYSFTFG